ncbi:MAG: winged helix-turn-helix transcriptional regulator [Oscillospiraceae bacterium]|jgi:DNA-binding MarR family transcriptional regulator|nr:winged helix-turn-helix transcriptional regulator [Oscillospiraceae bacterium]MCI8759178.1 winged helix-turn-helix transcriptional regulator [Oscillospiraceae bacterium]
MLNEELLEAWLRLSCVIDNQRLAADFPFNEALVCGLLSQGGCRTASELCARTRILKSQMNAILRSLESQGVIARQRSQTDRRQVELRLLPAGLERYRASHRQALDTVDRLISGMGEDAARQLLPLLRRAADAFDTMQKEI